MNYKDLHHLSENSRIRTIADAAMKGQVAAIVEDQPEKIARYLKKMAWRFPLVQHIETAQNTPKEGFVALVFGPRTKH